MGKDCWNRCLNEHGMWYGEGFRDKGQGTGYMARGLGSCLTCEANCTVFLRDTCGFGGIQTIFFCIQSGRCIGDSE